MNYRYLTTESRFYSSRDTRLTGKLLQETAPFFSESDIDYVDGVSIKDIGEEDSVTIDLELKSDMTHYSIYRTRSLSELSGTVSQTFLWANDIPAVKIFAIQGATNSVIQLAPATGFAKFEKADERSVIIINETRYVIQYIDGPTRAFITSELGVPVTGSLSGVGHIGEGTQVQLDISGTPNVFENGTADMVGKVLFFPNGATAIGKKFTQDESIGLIEVQPLSDLPSNPLVVYSPTKRSYTDSVPDSTLLARSNSGQSLYYLQTRFHLPLRNSKIGAVIGGAYFTTPYGQGGYSWSQVANLFRFGYYHPAYQSNSKISGAITRFKAYPNYLVIFGKNFTYLVDPSLIINSGEERLGEFIPTFTDPRLLTSKIGVLREGSCTSMGDGMEIMLTGEPAVRVFNGTSYSENLADGSIQNTKIANLYHAVITDWDSRNGFRLWGSIAVPGKAIEEQFAPPSIGDIIETGDNEFVVDESGQRDSEVIENG